MRIEMMRADTELKRTQIQTETWKTGAAVGGMIVGAFGAGVAFLAALLTFLKYWHGGN